MRLLLTILFILELGTVLGQPVDMFRFPVVKKEGLTIESFIPDRWLLVEFASGDLNNDHKMDMAIVIESKDSLQTFTHLDWLGEQFFEVNRSEKYKRRILLIVFKDSLSDKFNLLEQDNSIMLDQKSIKTYNIIEHIKIDNGLLKICRAGNAYDSVRDFNSVFSFQYQQGEFLFVTYNEHYTNRFSPAFEDYKFDFILQKWGATKGNMHEGQEPATVWKSMNNIELRTIKTFKGTYMSDFMNKCGYR